MWPLIRPHTRVNVRLLICYMNSATSPHTTHQHHYHQAPPLVFGQLPPTTYEATVNNPAAPPPSAPITVDTSSPPLGYTYHHQPHSNGGGAASAGGGGGRRGPGTIKWTKEGVSTSAERRLPFVHRFRPVGLPPPVGLVTSDPVTQQVQQQSYSHAANTPHPHLSKALNKMSQYETNPVGALQERYQSRGILPR